MDVCEILQRLHRKKEVDSIKESSNRVENRYGAVVGPSRTREARSIYKSPTPSVSRRSVTPNATRGVAGSANMAPKRAVSADRKRPATPPSPSQRQPRRINTAGNKMPEMLWPSATPGSSNSYEGSRIVPSVAAVSSIRRLFVEDSGRGEGNRLVDEITKTSAKMKAVDDTIVRLSMMNKLKMPKTRQVLESRSLPGSRMSSPSRSSGSRGTSPLRIRPSSPPQQMSSDASSVLSFISDSKREKKGISQLDDLHHIRLLCSRYSQWRFANAQADATWKAQKIAAEDSLYNVWRETVKLSNSVIAMRINRQQLQLELSMNRVLNGQLAYLEDWGLLERDHSMTVDDAIDDLKASTLRLPIIEGATADVVSLKASVAAAAAVMQSMMSSICSVLSKAEWASGLVSELAEFAVEERAMLEECETILASTALVQEEEYSFRAMLIQLLQEAKL